MWFTALTVVGILSVPSLHGQLCGDNIATMQPYPVELVRAIDGDTQEVELTLGFGVKFVTKIRLLGVDTPEMHGEEKLRGIVVKRWVEDWWGGKKELRFRMSKVGKYGRMVGYVVDSAGTTLNDSLLKSKHAVSYCGGKRNPVKPVPTP